MSFLEGFTGSLGQHFSTVANEKRQDKRARADYEYKLKMAKELEKSTAVKQEVFQRGNEWVAVGINSQGGVVGGERKASDWEIATKKREQEALELDKRSKETGIRADNARVRSAELDMKYRPAAEKRLDQASIMDTLTGTASANYSNAAAANQLAQPDLRREEIKAMGARNETTAEARRLQEVDEVRGSKEYAAAQQKNPKQAAIIMEEFENGLIFGKGGAKSRLRAVDEVDDQGNPVMDEQSTLQATLRGKQ